MSFLQHTLLILAGWLGFNLGLFMWYSIKGFAVGARNAVLNAWPEDEEAFNGYLPPRAR